MKKLINIISKAIDCPLMDTHNIPLEIADYLVHRIFYLEYFGGDMERRIIIKGCFLATNEEHAWELYEQYSKNIEYRVEKYDFMMNLMGGYGYYLTTDGASVRHLKVNLVDDLDEYNEYEYKHPTKNVLRKKISQRARQHNIWCLPMIDVMMDGAEYNPVTILRR
jgi:hypothetical protein